MNNIEIVGGLDYGGHRNVSQIRSPNPVTSMERGAAVATAFRGRVNHCRPLRRAEK
jgi:hypothetical protein